MSRNRGTKRAENFRVTWAGGIEVQDSHSLLLREVDD